MFRNSPVSPAALSPGLVQSLLRGAVPGSPAALASAAARSLPGSPAVGTPVLARSLPGSPAVSTPTVGRGFFGSPVVGTPGRGIPGAPGLVGTPMRSVPGTPGTPGTPHLRGVLPKEVQSPLVVIPTSPARSPVISPHTPVLVRTPVISPVTGFPGPGSVIRHSAPRIPGFPGPASLPVTIKTEPGAISMMSIPTSPVLQGRDPAPRVTDRTRTSPVVSPTVIKTSPGSTKSAAAAGFLVSPDAQQRRSPVRESVRGSLSPQGRSAGRGQLSPSSEHSPTHGNPRKPVATASPVKEAASPVIAHVPVPVQRIAAPSAPPVVSPPAARETPGVVSTKPATPAISDIRPVSLPTVHADARPVGLPAVQAAPTTAPPTVHAAAVAVVAPPQRPTTFADLTDTSPLLQLATAALSQERQPVTPTRIATTQPRVPVRSHQVAPPSRATSFVESDESRPPSASTARGTNASRASDAS